MKLNDDRNRCAIEKVILRKLIGKVRSVHLKIHVIFEIRRIVLDRNAGEYYVRYVPVIMQDLSDSIGTGFICAR